MIPVTNVDTVVLNRISSREFNGKLSASATCRIATEIETDHATNHTRSGLELAFWPHANKFGRCRRGGHTSVLQQGV